MIKTTYHIHKMDCASEENMVRMKLKDLPFVKKLEFDLENRILKVYHDGDNKKIGLHLDELGLGSRQVSSELTGNILFDDEEYGQRKLLWIVLIINAGFFVIECTTGLFSKSMGLVADALDMLADAIVYGLSLWAVGSTLSRKKLVATISGYFQLMLAIVGLLEVARRFLGVEGLPDFHTMVIVSALALIANATCLYMLQKSKSKEAHIKASLIFTSNDVIINAGVILAGILVLLTNSGYPDLIIGSVIFLIVARAAFRIMNLGK